uniref:Uncharacterized protein n=1 Tax=Lactuca sativa TaxID=4236 RepID=A0A9R1WU81_LACSA|nr:hypothetical protein LSAT_V11C900483290 [Lactuca sativa]
MDDIAFSIGDFSNLNLHDLVVLLKDAEGIDDFGAGEMITEPTWGSTYSVRVASGRSRKVFFGMNGKERFPNNVLEGMVPRIMLNS